MVTEAPLQPASGSRASGVDINIDIQAVGAGVGQLHSVVAFLEAFDATLEAASLSLVAGPGQAGGLLQFDSALNGEISVSEDFEIQA